MAEITATTSLQTSTLNGAAVASRLSMKWSAALLARFANIWPKAWAETTKFASHDDLILEWAKGLDGLSGDEIRFGIDCCRCNNTWPPSIAEFRTACRGGANAEQRAYAARAREDQEDTQALRHGTWGDTAAVVTEHVQAVRAKVADRLATRSLVDIAAGRWTREMEANFCRHAAFLGRKVKAIEWPDEAIA